MSNLSIFKQRSTSLALALLICAVNVGVATPTGAYYSDLETSPGNQFIGATLDFTVTADTTNYVGLTPNNSSPALPVKLATTSDSLPFDYEVSVGNFVGNVLFCNALTLRASLESVMKAEAPLGSFAITSSSSFPQGGEDWSFMVSLGAAVSTFSGASCTFDVVYDGWQVGFEKGIAFQDTEKTTFVITAGMWQDTPEDGEAVLDMAAIRDSSIDESKPNTNSAATSGGNSQQLELRRAAGNDSEAFIGFDYKLPAGSVVTGAELKAYLYQTPIPNTTYEVARVTSTWSEGGVTWNTKPTSVVSDTTLTGDSSAKWLTWDVTSDVQGVVGGTYGNHGWSLRDTGSIPAGSRSGKFRSSEHTGQSDVRPVLEVTFDAPTATTDHLVINEVFYDVDSGNGSDTNNEWIELYNPTAFPISIENWDICDNTSCDNITTPTPIPAYGFAVIANNSSTFNTFWTSVPAEAIKIALGMTLGNGLAANGDRIILKNASDTIIDQVNYGNDTMVFNPAVAITGEDGKSIARVVKGWDTDSRDDWILNATPNPGTNPGSDQIEIVRFTQAGVEVAAISVGLKELPELSNSELALLLTQDLARAQAVAAASQLLEEIVEAPVIDLSEVSITEEASTEDGVTNKEPVIKANLEDLPQSIIEAREEDVLAPLTSGLTPAVEEVKVVMPKEGPKVTPEPIS